MSSSTWLILSLVLGSFLIIAVSTLENEIYDSRDIKSGGDKRPFFTGSRYGRSQTVPINEGKQVRVVTRNDRFFLGSRYGKRSSFIPAVTGDNQYLQCKYTEYSDIYRCYIVDPINTDSGPDDEK